MLKERCHTPAQTTKAIFQEQANHKDELTMETDRTLQMESITKGDTLSSDIAVQVAEPKPQECNKNYEPPKMNEEHYQQPEIINENSIKEAAAMTSNSTVDDADSSDEEVAPVCEVKPKEWCHIHDEWLHAAMRAAMGDMTLTSIPDIKNVECMEQKPPATNLNRQPT